MEKPTQGRLISFRSDRLGGRLNCIVNTLRLHEKFGWDYCVVWPLADDASHTADINDPGTIFAPDMIENKFLFINHYRNISTKPKSFRHFKDRSAKALQAYLDSGCDIVIDLAFEMYQVDGETEEDVRAGYAAAFKDLPLAEDVAKAKQEISDRLDNTVGYHLRRGDIVNSIRTQEKPWTRKFVPDEIYHQHINAQAKKHGKDIIIFSDDDVTIQRFRKRHPNMITFEDVFRPDGMSQGARDFLELYAMSRCERLIAPEHSAFSSMAAELGGCEKVSVLDDLKPEQVDRSFKKIMQRLDARPETFRSDGEVAQHLAHLHEWAQDEETIKNLIKIERRYIDAGNNVPFLYSQTMEQMFRIGQDEEIVDVQQQLKRAGLTQKKYLAEALTFWALSRVRQGDLKLAVDELVLAMWQSRPMPRLLRDIIGVLMMKGYLNDKNFFPAPAEVAERESSRLAPSDKGFPYAEMRELFEVPDDWNSVVMPDLVFLLWDFATGAFTRNYSMKRGRMPSGELTYVDRSSQYKTVDGTAVAIYIRHLDQDEHNEENRFFEGMLSDLEGQEGASAMVPYLISRCCVWNGARWHDAREAAERMMEKGGDLPGYKAWYAHTLMHTRSHEEAAKLFGEVAETIPGIPAFYDDQFKSYMLAGQYENARDAAAKANDLIAYHPTFLRSLSQAEEALGNLEEAANVLEESIQLGFTASRWIYYRMISVQIKLGNAKRAREVLDKARQRDANWVKFDELEKSLLDLETRAASTAS